eukprot:CAMPEP_0194499282 /NCGR_PEP_ID=MMETSP0253-20130528/15637_1 /TAXON_ID=2966 /ORGANISM="Noctiluca scintillans" /LENGTH=253 /DNA_ID=CAMNT_0039341017 /DNA_START=112 /DNA_END=874 /DNA_ORIENTATION=+
MNVLTAIYCNAASCVQAVDRELVILEQTEESSVVEGELRALFQVCSTNGNLDLKTLRSQLANPLIVDLLRFMEVEINNVAGLFKMLDVRGDGCVGVEEFVVGMMRLRGTARSMDMTLMMQQQVELCTQVSALASFTAQNFEALRGVENRGTVDRIEDLKELDVAKHRANAERSFARKELLMKEAEGASANTLLHCVHSDESVMSGTLRGGRSGDFRRAVRVPCEERVEGGDAITLASFEFLSGIFRSQLSKPF